MFTNKHVIAALIITPILAVLAYFSVDSLVSEKPHKAVAGNNYPLVAKPNCRYSSGRCSMKNGEFEVHFTLSEQPGGLKMELDSVFPLDGVRVSLAESNQSQDLPVELQPVNNDNTRWTATFPVNYQGTEQMRVVLSAQGVFYYGETVAAFGHYETSYGGDFREKL